MQPPHYLHSTLGPTSFNSEPVGNSIRSILDTDTAWWYHANGRAPWLPPWVLIVILATLRTADCFLCYYRLVKLSVLVALTTQDHSLRTDLELEYLTLFSGRLSLISQVPRKAFFALVFLRELRDESDESCHASPFTRFLCPREHFSLTISRCRLPIFSE